MQDLPGAGQLSDLDDIIAQLGVGGLLLFLLTPVLIILGIICMLRMRRRKKKENRSTVGNNKQRIVNRDIGVEVYGEIELDDRELHRLLGDIPNIENTRPLNYLDIKFDGDGKIIKQES